MVYSAFTTGLLLYNEITLSVNIKCKHISLIMWNAGKILIHIYKRK